MDAAGYLSPVLYEDGMQATGVSAELFPTPLPPASFNDDVDSYFSFDDSPARSILPLSTTTTPATPLSPAAPSHPSARVKEEDLVPSTKASKKTRGLPHILVPAPLATPSSPFTLSPSSGSVSPVPSTPSLSSSTNPPTPSPSPPPSTLDHPLAESALKRSRLARKAELARLGRKRKNEAIDRYAGQVEELEKELRGVRVALERERKAHRKTTKMLASMGRGMGGTAAVGGEVVMVRPPPLAKVELVAAVVERGKGEERLPMCQGMLSGLAAFCRERGVPSTTADSASTLLLSHMRGLTQVQGGSEEWARAMQSAVVEGDAHAGLLARFVLWWVAQPTRAEVSGLSQVQLDALLHALRDGTKIA